MFSKIISYAQGFTVGISLIVIAGLYMAYADLYKDHKRLIKQLNGPYQCPVYTNGHIDKNRKA